MRLNSQNALFSCTYDVSNGVEIGRRYEEVSSDYMNASAVVMKKRENIRAADIFKVEVNERLMIETSRILPAVRSVAFLYEAYRPKYWYWECVECLRRLSLTGLLVFMYPGGEKQIIIATLICVLFMILYSWVHPFLDPIHNFVLLSAKWGIFLQLFGTLLLKQDQFGSSSATIGGAMITVGVLFPLTPLIIWREWVVTLNRLLQPRVGKGSQEKAIEMYLEGSQEHKFAIINPLWQVKK